MNNILKDDDIPFLQNILWMIFCQKNTLYKGIHAPYWLSAIRIQPVPSYTDFVQPNKYQSLMYYTDSVHSFITSQRTTQSTGSSYINIQHTKLHPPFYHLTVKYWSHSCKIYFQFCAKKNLQSMIFNLAPTKPHNLHQWSSLAELDRHRDATKELNCTICENPIHKMLPHAYMSIADVAPNQ